MLDNPHILCIVKMPLQTICSFVQIHEQILNFFMKTKQ